MIVRVNVVLNRTVVNYSDWSFDNLCGSHLRSQSELYHVSWWYYTLVIDLIGQLRRNVIGHLSVKPWCYWLWRLVIIRFLIPCTLYTNYYLRRTDPTNNCFPKNRWQHFQEYFSTHQKKGKKQLVKPVNPKNIKFCWWLNAGISFLNIVSIKSLLESNDQLNMPQVTIIQGLITEH